MHWGIRQTRIMILVDNIIVCIMYTYIIICLSGASIKICKNRMKSLQKQAKKQKKKKIQKNTENREENQEYLFCIAGPLKSSVWILEMGLNAYTHNFKYHCIWSKRTTLCNFYFIKNLNILRLANGPFFLLRFWWCTQTFYLINVIRFFHFFFIHPVFIIQNVW